jgi:hypothetical protein
MVNTQNSRVNSSFAAVPGNHLFVHVKDPPEPPERPRRKRAQPSEHRDQADMASLELAGHRLGGAQRHQPGLLNRTATAPEVEAEAGGSGLAGAGMGQDHHAADRAAEESGGHGWMARNTGPNAPPQRPCQGAVGACVSPCTRRGGWGSAGVVLAPAWPRPYCCLRWRWFCRSSRPCPHQAPTARSARAAWPYRSAGSGEARGCTAAGGPRPRRSASVRQEGRRGYWPGKRGSQQAPGRCSSPSWRCFRGRSVRLGSWGHSARTNQQRA